VSEGRRRREMTKGICVTMRKTTKTRARLHWCFNLMENAQAVGGRMLLKNGANNENSNPPPPKLREDENFMRQ
jgi:hypothetical protein